MQSGRATAMTVRKPGFGFLNQHDMALKCALGCVPNILLGKLGILNLFL